MRYFNVPRLYDLRWFSQNLKQEFKDHPKMEAIPIGLPNRRVGQYKVSKLVKYLKNVPPAYDGENGMERDRLLYASFTPRDQFRKDALRNFANLSDAGTGEGSDNQDAYFEALTRSKFTLSPPGIRLPCRLLNSILVSTTLLRR